MTRRHTPFAEVTGIALGLAALSVACTDPTKPDFTPVEVVGEEICEASADWLPNTPELAQFLPVPHPAGECPFYRSGWQNFLRAMQPDLANGGRPALIGYPTIDDVFHPVKAHPASRSYLGDVKQAGGRQILIDGNGNSLYYGIHVNDAFAKFIQDNGLQTGAALQAYPTDPAKKNLLFPAGVTEFKSAWQVVEGTPDEVAAQMANYITMTTTVPTLSQDGPPSFTIHEDRNTPRMVTVRLLAIHVVSTLVGHPEFIWASFEHSTGMANNEPDSKATDNQRDVAPILDGDKQPDADNNITVTKPASMDPHVLYAAGTPANQANHAFVDTEMRLVGQKFMLASDMTKPAQTSIYRLFPASKSNTTDPDAAITSLNHNVEVLFTSHPDDKRGNYRLVGAQWMDKPGYYGLNLPLQNDATSPMANPSQRLDGKHIAQDGSLADPISKQALISNIQADGSDSEFSILAGEDRMSSTSMESFTQTSDAFPNCFNCHNTQAITAKGISSDRDSPTSQIKLLAPGLLNVSHILSQFLLEEYEAGSLTPAP